LEDKNKKLIINRSNINDIQSLLGPPLTKSKFDNNVLIYIERKTSSTKLSKLGKQELLKNNVLVLELDNTNILLSKKFYTKEDMSEVNFDKSLTKTDYTLKNDFIYSFLASVRQKANDPLGKKRIK